MASQINTTTINTAYPVAGQDNDSQGFRDNFTNINNNFGYAKGEIEDLQSKVVLKSALIGTVLDNNMAGALIRNAQVRGFMNTVQDLGAVLGAVAIDPQAAPYYKMSPTGAITLSFAAAWNVTGAGVESVVELEVNITNVAQTITLPTLVGNYYGLDSVVGANGLIITAPEIGLYRYRFSTTDGGSNVLVESPTQSQFANRVHLVTAPTTSVGAAGDLPGMIAQDATYVYLCFAAHDGVSTIWRRWAWDVTVW